MELRIFRENLSLEFTNKRDALVRAGAIGALASGVGVIVIGGSAPVALTAMAMSVSALFISVVAKAANKQLKWVTGDAERPALTAISIAAVRIATGMMNPHVAAIHFLFSLVLSETLQVVTEKKQAPVVIV